MHRTVRLIALVGVTAGACALHTHSAGPAVPAFLVVSPDQLTLTPFDSVHVGVAVLDRDSALLTGVPVKFRSSDTTIVRVSPTGVVHSIGHIDTATIIVTTTGLTKNVPVSVSGVPFAIDVSPADTNIRPGGSYQLRSAVVDQFGDTLPGQLFTYQSSNPAVVAVSTSGVVHSVGSAGVVFVAVHSGTLQTQAVVRVMDTSIVARLPLNGAPHGAGISPSGVVYITLGSAHALEQLDVPSRTFTGTVQVGAAPTRVLFDPAGATAYVSNQLSQNIGVVNVTSNTETSTIAVSGNPVPVRVSANGQWLYVATDFNRLYRISRSTNRATDSIALPATSHFALLHPNDTLLYVATRDGGRVLEVNVWTWTVLRTFTIGGLTQGMALSPDGHELYVANEVLPEVHVVDLTSGSVADSIPLDGGAFGLALSADGSSLYASLPGVGEVLVLNRTGRSVRKSIIVTGVPREIVVYPTSGVAVVPNEAGWVDIVR